MTTIWFGSVALSLANLIILFGKEPTTSPSPPDAKKGWHSDAIIAIFLPSLVISP